VKIGDKDVKETVWIKSIRVTLNGKPITSLGSDMEKFQCAQVRKREREVFLSKIIYNTL